MADSTSGSNTAIVAVLVIFLVAVLGAGLFVFRGQIFGQDAKKVEINVTAPAEK